jgi:hypothetical protein
VCHGRAQDGKMMINDNRDPSLCRSFVAKAKADLIQHPEVKHSWSIDEDEDHCILDIPKAAQNGFDITIEVFPNEITVLANGLHLHFDDIKDVEKTVQNVLGMLRELLSPSMRVVEFRSNGHPYRWVLESFRNNRWHREDTTGIVFYNIFGRRTKNIYQNQILPRKAEGQVLRSRNDGK